MTENIVIKTLFLPDFENAKECVSAKKNDLSRKVRECIITRLEEENDSQEIFTSVPQILNTEGWVRTSTDGDVDL